MRFALLCVFVALIVHKGGSLAADEDFKPTPIPLNDWNGERGGAGEVIDSADAKTQNDTTGSAVSPATDTPPRYWEDALRHSVYLTLVRDKIDQLIAKGSVVSPDGKLDHSLKEIDDHDLWEKIKAAPFDRLKAEEPVHLGDITVMSKGRLLEQQDGLKFTEDESKKKCDEETCMEGVKAYWSVKRVRQRDAETVPGKYHYELTFYVSSQTHKKQKKPQDNPVRTFTVREGTPVERPQYRIQEPVAPAAAPRPQRAIWVHKNIAPPPLHQGRKQENGLDRLFSSWFSSEEEPPVKRYKQVYVPPVYPQRSKVGHAGAPAEQHHHHQKYPMPYPHKPQSATTYKYSRPPLGPPPTSYSPHQHHYVDLEPIRHQNQYTIPQPDYNHLSSNIIKTTKPAVLPTPVSYAPVNLTMTVTHNLNETENSTRDPEIHTAYNNVMYNKPKQPPTKMSYFPEHVRPPVFNAPPGVFVTMDKKPFKPMPPLKHMHSHKQNKYKPVDFRPSPQVLDVQFSEPDPMSDAFRPITMSYAASNTSKTSELINRDRHNKPIRKTKPPKKHDDMTTHRTTSAPEIITAGYEGIEEMHWADVLGAFVKTTPSMSYKTTASDTTTFIPPPTDSSTSTVQPSPSTTEVETVTMTTSKPRRTRPPPKFTKPLKAKKHKRVTSTTTPTTTTTTEKPHQRREDLTPQATSGWQPKSKVQNESISTTPISANDSIATSSPEPSTTKMIPTTYRALTTKPPRTSTAVPLDATAAATVATIDEKNKMNRFRQSTLMLKGTSVNHDKWSSPHQIDKNKTSIERTRSPVSGKYPRRKGSNFLGYGAYTQKTVDERNRVDHIDRVYNPKDLQVISLTSSSRPTTEVAALTTSKPTEATYEELVDQKEQNELEGMSGTDGPDSSVYSDDADEAEETDEDTTDEQQKKDNDEYIFDTSSDDFSKDSNGLAEKSNEIEPEIVITTQKTVVTSPHLAVKNKTKCTKKKNKINETPKSVSEDENDVLVAPIATTTEKLSTADFFQQIFGLTTDANGTEDNQPESRYDSDSDKDLEEFLESIHEKNESPDAKYDVEYEDDKDDEQSPFNNDEDNKYARNADSAEDYQDRPYSFLELLDME